ncbi:conserved hypothetical protein [Vibrio chagasii]|nr:conserved hypothetical protein [Vibrio chagasii]CAH6851155.1 conserved hypothetical protein [Vibrio chagasii]CAH7174919.1 conserved hypothetical protein [Vibrio chagasii]
MIHYHGGPITPDPCAIKAWKGRHAFVSFAHTSQLGLASEICQSFALDNGAFTFWKQGKEIDWNEYQKFVGKWKHHPRCDFAIIPDVIGAGEKENDRLIELWPHGSFGVPVWHMDESEERLIKLACKFPRVAIGSCGEYDVKYPAKCVDKLKDVIQYIVDQNSYPICKLHGLRMLNKTIFTQIPLSSADSTNVARNIGIDKKWKGAYSPSSKETRTSILVERIESFSSSSKLDPPEVKPSIQLGLLF